MDSDHAPYTIGFLAIVIVMAAVMKGDLLATTTMSPEYYTTASDDDDYIHRMEKLGLTFVTPITKLGFD